MKLLPINNNHSHKYPLELGPKVISRMYLLFTYGHKLGMNRSQILNFFYLSFRSLDGFSKNIILFSYVWII